MRILLAEDHDELAHQVQRRIKRSGFAVDRVSTIRDILFAISTYDYVLAVLDRKLPDGDALTILPRIRTQRPGTRLLILSALDAVGERINGLDAGADDYLIKPCDLDEMMARIRSNLRRQNNETAPPITVGALSFDLSSRSVMVAGKSAIFRHRELALLESLVRRAGRIVERSALMSEIWGFEDDVQSHALTIVASRLRSRLHQLGAGLEIHMVRGVGYFIAESEA